MASPLPTPLSPEEGGDANRALGRRPEEGLRVFFKMGGKGGGREDEGVGGLTLPEGVESCSALCSECWVVLASWGLPALGMEALGTSQSCE